MRARHNVPVSEGGTVEASRTATRKGSYFAYRPKDNPHILPAGKDYPVCTSRLPEGYVMLDEIRIDFCAGSPRGTL